MSTSILSLSVGGILAGLGWSVLHALVADALEDYVSRRWPRFAQWWDGPAGLCARLTFGLLFFTAAAVFFGLLTAGFIGGVEPDGRGLILTLPSAAMAFWFLVNIARLRASGASRRGYGRSSDGSWSAG